MKPKSPKAAMAIESVMWTDLYKPETIKDIIGNRGNVNMLFEWLKDWDEVHIRGNKKPVPKSTGRNWQDQQKVNAKSVLVSGPPGIGKTSACRIVCKHLGYEVMEMNASDCRSKTAISSMLNTLSTNKSIDYFTTHGKKK